MPARMISEAELSAFPAFWREMNDGPNSEGAREASADHFEITIISDTGDLFRGVGDLDGGQVGLERFEKNRYWGACQ